MALQTPGRWTLALKQISSAMAEVRPLVHVHVADTLVMFEDRDLRVCHHETDQSFSAPRDDQVDMVLLLEKDLDRLAVAHGNHLGGFRRQAGNV